MPGMFSMQALEDRKRCIIDRRGKRPRRDHVPPPKKTTKNSIQRSSSHDDSHIEEHTTLQKIATHEQWTSARKELLAKEKEFTRLRDELSRKRRELPWEKVEKRDRVFEGPQGNESLADLFSGRSQLAIYHFMLGPGWKEGIPVARISRTASMARRSIWPRGTRLSRLSRVRPRRRSNQKRMGWKFKWVSSFGSDFNFDYHISRSAEGRERPGLLQLRDDGISGGRTPGSQRLL